MADLSGYKDLSRSPMMSGDDLSEGTDSSVALTDSDIASSTSSVGTLERMPSLSAAMMTEDSHQGELVDTEFSGNVQTLIRLVNDLPDGVTKQTGAQIIRLTMEAMGISMEEVLSEAQTAQSEMLEAVRANIKKIEEFKTVIRKLESDIKFYQGKANELSEIIDLFILSNTSSGRVPTADELAS